ncbi:MAG: NAD(P)H-dependent oxidoreductase [Chitinophagaceae bacterium]|nr:NAD(P)H-dependent oxidoreductase [Chitinophagaceae bacterium]
MVDKIKILAISGSFRTNSSNTNILRTITTMAPENVEVILYEGLGGLPHFNPVLDDENSSSAVKELRDLLLSVHGVIVCTPEYAFGVPGSLKNALDWTVSSGELTNKPVAVITASLVGEKAHAALLQIFTALSSSIAEGATLLIPFIRTKLNEKGEVSDADTLQSIQKVLNSLLACIENQLLFPDSIYTK